MPAKKYAKHLTTEVVSPDPKMSSGASTRPLMEKWGGGHMSLDCFFIKQPMEMLKQPHKHEFPQYLHFFSANPNNSSDFDAEIELTLGDEGEKYIITKPTAVYVAAGLAHGPLNFKKINKPVLFLDAAVTGKYSRVGNTPD